MGNFQKETELHNKLSSNQINLRKYFYSRSAYSDVFRDLFWDRRILIVIRGDYDKNK